MVIYVEDSNATISEVLANLQSIFSGVESLGKAVEFGDKVAVPIYQFNFGTGGGGGGGGREGRTNNAVAFGLGGTIGPVAIVILEKDVLWSRRHTYSRVQVKQARRSACRTYAPFVEYG